MPADYNPQFVRFYNIFMQQLAVVVPPSVNLPEAYEKGTDDQQKFVQNLALFFTSFFKVRLTGLGRAWQRHIRCSIVLCASLCT